MRRSWPILRYYTDTPLDKLRKITRNISLADMSSWNRTKFFGMEPYHFTFARICTVNRQTKYKLWNDLMFSRPWLWWLLSSAMRFCAVLQTFTDVSEEFDASYFRVEDKAERTKIRTDIRGGFTGTGVAERTMDSICFLLSPFCSHISPYFQNLSSNLLQQQSWIITFLKTKVKLCLLKLEVVHASETSRNFYQTTQRHIPDYLTLHSHCREKPQTRQMES
jgi:hypothetical protein